MKRALKWLGLVVLLVCALWRPAVATYLNLKGGLGEISASSYSLGYTVDVTVAETFVEVVPTTTLTRNTGLWAQPANGRLQWVGPVTADFHCGATFSARGSLGPGDTLVAACAINGTVYAPSYQTLDVKADNSAVTPHCEISLEPNQYLSLVITNADDTDDFMLDALNVFCMRGM